MSCEFIGKLLRLGEQASVQELKDETALLLGSILGWLEEAEQHQVGVDLYQVTCAQSRVFSSIRILIGIRVRIGIGIRIRTRIIGTKVKIQTRTRKRIGSRAMHSVH